MVAVPTVLDIRNRFPTFTLADYPDALVKAVLDEAQGYIDDTWVVADQKPAIMYLAAHMLLTEWYSTLGFGIPASVHFEDRSITFVNRLMQGTSRSFAATTYGEQFLLLARRNNPPILVTGDNAPLADLPVLSPWEGGY